MKRLLAAALAAFVFAFVWLVMRFAPDICILAVIKLFRVLLRMLDPQNFGATVLGDAEKIFIDKKSSALARRLILEARPAQVRAVLRGAFL
jgi:hypothetical protein